MYRLARSISRRISARSLLIFSRPVAVADMPQRSDAKVALHAMLNKRREELGEAHPRLGTLDETADDVPHGGWCGEKYSRMNCSTGSMLSAPAVAKDLGDAHLLGAVQAVVRSCRRESASRCAVAAETPLRGATPVGRPWPARSSRPGRLARPRHSGRSRPSGEAAYRAGRRASA